jgi:hypothetical protein
MGIEKENCHSKNHTTDVKRTAVLEHQGHISRYGKRTAAITPTVVAPVRSLQLEGGPLTSVNGPTLMQSKKCGSQPPTAVPPIRRALLEGR